MLFGPEWIKNDGINYYELTMEIRYSLVFICFKKMETNGMSSENRNDDISGNGLFLFSMRQS